jgi:hypothetical protein
MFAIISRSTWNKVVADRIEAERRIQQLERAQQLSHPPEFDAELIDEQLAVAVDSRMFRAIHALLGERIANEVQATVLPTLTAEQRQHQSGRAASLMEFQSYLLDRAAASAPIRSGKAA